MNRRNERSSFPAGIGRWVTITGGVVVLDQGTKLLARHCLAHVSLVAGPVGLVLTMNSGVAFGMFGGQRWVVPLNALLGLLVLGAAVMAIQRRRWGFAHGLLLIFAGFLGNFVDRLIAGRVTDFLWVRGWSVFNVADCCVTAGAILCALALLFPERWGKA